MAIETQVPPWLSRNWSPRETFDPSPWLQQGYERKIQEQTIPLKIQQMALQNQAAQAAIEHQGMVNETAGLQLQSYQSELPQLKELAQRYVNDPVGLMNHVASFTNPIVQKQWLDMQTNAAKTQTGLAAIEQGKQKWIAARELMVSGIENAPPLELDDNGNPSQDWISKMQNLKGSEEEKLFQRRYSWHMTIDPETGEEIPVSELNAQIRAKAMADREKRLKEREDALTTTAQNRLISQDRVLQDWQKQYDKAQKQLSDRTAGGPSALQQIASKIPGADTRIGVSAWQKETDRLQKMVDDLGAKIDARKAELTGQTRPLTTRPVTTVTTAPVTTNAPASDPLGLFSK